VVGRRLSKRVSVNRPATWSHDEGSIDGTCRDLSGNGCSLHTQARPALGVSVRVTVHLPSGPFTAVAEVVRTRDVGGCEEVGLYLKHLDQENLAALHRYLAQQERERAGGMTEEVEVGTELGMPLTP
jgi:hypothetical protein